MEKDYKKLYHEYKDRYERAEVGGKMMLIWALEADKRADEAMDEHKEVALRAIAEILMACYDMTFGKEE